MNKTERKKVLEAKKKEILKRIPGHKEDLRETIDLGGGLDDIDRLQNQMNAAVVRQLAESATNLLNQIEKAIAQIDSGEEPFCLKCDELIPEKRIKAIPSAIFCVTCQADIEKALADGDDEADIFSFMDRPAVKTATVRAASA